MTGTGANEVISGPNPKRRAVYVRANTGQTVTVKFGVAITSNTDGWLASNTGAMFVITRDDIGDAIVGQLNTFANAGVGYSVVEVIE
jgi:hypothetical protein